jgi:hypothetical protein
MSTQARTIAIAVGVVVVVIAVIVVAVNSTGGGATAVSFNGKELSLGSLNNQLEGMTDSAYFRQAFPSSGTELTRGPGSVNSLVAAYLVSLHIQNSALAEELDAQGLKLTNQELDDARTTLEQGGLLKGMPADLQDEFVTLEARLDKLNTAIGSDAMIAAVKKRLQHARVEIDPRYGSWDTKKLGVCPPSGCQQVLRSVPQAPTSTTTPSG